MRDSDFILECVHLRNKINFKRGRSYLDSPDWIKYNKAKINLINKNNRKCF